MKEVSSFDLTRLWPWLKYICSVAVFLSLSTSRLSSVSPVVQMGLSLLSEQQPLRPGSIVTWEAAAGAGLWAGSTGRDRWMGGMRWPDWTGRQRHHVCPSASQAGRGVATPSLPGGRPSYMPCTHTATPQHTAGSGRRDRVGWKWRAAPWRYILRYNLHL